ncbi:MAG: indoleamine 2,3-dioxygenase [Novosphingobium sp.]|nr:indoleamine 2,3-dioxygenase [Novosphingobium sp.]
MRLADLDTYDMSRERGFLCRHDAAQVELEGELAEVGRIALRLPEFLPSGEVRRLLDRALPEPVSPAAIERLDDAQARLAMVHYSFMVQSYIWGEDEVTARLPASLAVPIVALADRLGRQPLLQYEDYVLNNWAKLDARGAVTLDNIHMIQKFAGGLDEAWFVLVHVAIEARAGDALALFGPIVEAAAKGDRARLTELLEGLVDVWADINAIFGRMTEKCDPHIYFRRVRPYIHGWKDNPAVKDGILYEGVARYQNLPQVFRGQTGSQSSIVPSMDALLGVGHAADPLKSYLDELHAYRPPAHRRFIEDVRTNSRLRAFVDAERGKGLVAAYNGVVEAVAAFRTLHLEYAASYINKQGGRSAGNDTEVGTGGTPFMKYLKKHRDETRANLIEA